MSKTPTVLGVAGLLSIGLMPALLARAVDPPPRILTDVANVPLLPDDGCVDDASGSGAGGIMRTIVLNGTGTIADVDVGFQMTHPFRSDIQAGISYAPVEGQALGPVTLINNHDSNGDNYFALFTDAGFTCGDLNFCGNVINCTTPPGPSCSGSGFLSGFDGARAPGTFTLSVCDRVGQDLGTLLQWSVHVLGVELTIDIDGNGTVSPLTDALLILRYSFGFRGGTLTTGAVAGDCTRCTVQAIEDYLALL